MFGSAARSEVQVRLLGICASFLCLYNMGQPDICVGHTSPTSIDKGRPRAQSGLHRKTLIGGLVDDARHLHMPHKFAAFGVFGWQTHIRICKILPSPALPPPSALPSQRHDIIEIYCLGRSATSQSGFFLASSADSYTGYTFLN